MVSNYHLPEQCCGVCEHSYQSTYGDYQCGMQPAGSCIDAGAVCDQFLQASEPVLQPKVETTPVPVVRKEVVRNDDHGTCIDCTYSGYAGEDTKVPFCFLKCNPLTEAKMNKGCKEHEYAPAENKEMEGTAMEEPIIEEEDIEEEQTCTTCFDSYVNEQGQAMCRYWDGMAIEDPNGTCAEYTDLDRSHICETCACSFYDKDNVPTCNKTMQPILEDELEMPCYDWEEEQ